MLFEHENPDVVINFAAESNVDKYIANPRIFLQTNIIETSIMIDTGRDFGNFKKTTERYRDNKS